MKISIIGYSGSGKSTLADRLGKVYQIPVLFLDTVHFTKGWVERDRQEALQIVREFMRQETWIIEGNYTAFAQRERLQQSDYIIFLDFPRCICLFRAIRRYLYYRGRTRKSMAEGCDEKFDWDFFLWILFYQRSRDKRKHFQEIVSTYNGKILVIHNQKQMDCLFKRLERGGELI